MKEGLYGSQLQHSACVAAVAKQLDTVVYPATRAILTEILIDTSPPDKVAILPTVNVSLYQFIKCYISYSMTFAQKC